MKRIYLFLFIIIYLSISENSLAQYYASEQQRVADDFNNEMLEKESNFKIQSEEMIELNKNITSKFVSHINNLQEQCGTFKNSPKLSDSQTASLIKLNDNLKSIPDYFNLSERNMKNKVDAATERKDRYCPTPNGDLRAYINCREKVGKLKMILQISLESIRNRYSLLQAREAVSNFYNCAYEKKSIDSSDIENINKNLKNFIEVVTQRDNSIQNTASKLLN